MASTSPTGPGQPGGNSPPAGRPSGIAATVVAATVIILLGYASFFYQSNLKQYSQTSKPVWHSYIENPKRLIFVCCQAEPKAAREFHYKTFIGNDDMFSRFIPRYNNDQHNGCAMPMPAGSWARQSFLERIKNEANGTGGRYIVSQLATCDGDWGDDQEVWNIQIDSMLKGEDIVSDATKTRYALQDKGKLYQIFSRLGLGEYVPKQYKFPKVLPDRYPVIVKRTQGAWGKGVSIVKSRLELDEIILQDRNHLQPNDMNKQAGVKYVVQEAIVNVTEHVLHYVRTPKGFPGKGWTKVWCGIYSHPDFVDKGGLFVKGFAYKGNFPTLRRTNCDGKVVRVALAVMEDVDVSGFGCLNYKYAETKPKVFDWNLRHCGSQSPKIIEELLAEPPAEIH